MLGKLRKKLRFDGAGYDPKYDQKRLTYQYERIWNTVKDIILLDDRIGRNITVPGLDGDFGFGGKCFPKDLDALIHLAKEKKYNPLLLEEVWDLNKRVRKDKRWLEKIKEQKRGENE